MSITSPEMIPQKTGFSKPQLFSEFSIDPQHLQLPIVNLVSAYDQRYLESEFLSLFIALEALLNIYAKSRGRTKYFTDSKLWRKFKSYMKNALEKFPDMNKDDKKEMSKGLNNLNNYSLNAKYDDFCKEMHVDNSKLWPVFASEQGCHSLYYIRNKLVHGESFEDGYAMGVARHYLQWIVERCLLAVLGWRGPTNVDDEILRKEYMKYHDWRKYCR